MIEHQQEKQIKATEIESKSNSSAQIKDQWPSFSQNIFLCEEAIDELSKTIKIETEVNRDDLIRKTGNNKKDKTLIDKTYGFQTIQTIKYLERETYNYKLTLEDALKHQINLENEIDKFKEFTQPQNPDKKEKKSTNFSKRK